VDGTPGLDDASRPSDASPQFERATARHGDRVELVHERPSGDSISAPLGSSTRCDAR